MALNAREFGSTPNLDAFASPNESRTMYLSVAPTCSVPLIRGPLSITVMFLVGGHSICCALTLFG